MKNSTAFLAALRAALPPSSVLSEQEDTRPLRVPVDGALEALAGATLHYGAGVLGLQWLALNRNRLRDIVRQPHAAGGC